MQPVRNDAVKYIKAHGTSASQHPSESKTQQQYNMEIVVIPPKKKLGSRTLVLQWNTRSYLVHFTTKHHHLDPSPCSCLHALSLLHRNSMRIISCEWELTERLSDWELVFSASSPHSTLLLFRDNRVESQTHPPACMESCY